MKLNRILILSILTIFVSTGVLATNQVVDITVNGVPLHADVPAQVVNGRTLIPMRAILEKFEFKVQWNNSTKTVTAQKSGVSVKLTVDSNIAIVNNKEVHLDQPSIIINERTMVPVRFIAEILGANVSWDGTRQLALIDGLKINDNSSTAYYGDENLLYKGQVKNNQPHGKGTVYYEGNSIKYIGGFKGGKLDGYATHYNVDGGVIYKGDFKDDKKALIYTDSNYFKFDEKEGCIYGYSHKAPRDVVIPSFINGTAVTSIEDFTFYGMCITSVVIPDSVTSIGNFAFSSNEITSITIPSSLIHIGDHAFNFNSLIPVIVLPDSVKSIGKTAFTHTRLTSVTIPISATNIAHDAFDEGVKIIRK